MCPFVSPAGLSLGVIVGITVGSVVLLGVVTILLMYGFKQYHHHHQKLKIASLDMQGSTGIIKQLSL